MKYFAIAAAIAAFLIPPKVVLGTTAHRTSSVRYANSSSAYVHNLLEGAAINTTQSATITTKGLYGKLILGIEYTNSSATAVTVAPFCSYGTNTNDPFFRLQSRSVSGGTATLTDFTDSNAVSGNENFYLEYQVKGCHRVRFDIDGTGAGAGDLVDVQATGIAGD